MKSIKKIGLFFLSLTVLFFSLTSCDRGEEPETDKKEITFYTLQLRPDFTDFINEMIAEFESENPGVKVNWMDVAADGFQARLMSMVRRGETPDVMNLSYDLAPAFFERGIIIALDDYMPENIRDEFFPEIIESAAIRNDQLHSLPWYHANAITIFNRSVMEDAGLEEEDYPETWLEVYEMAPEFYQNAGKFLFMIPFGDKTVIRDLFERENIPLNEPDGKPIFNHQEAVDFFEKIIQMYQNRGIPRGSLLYEHRDEIELFQNRELGMFTSGPQFIRILKENAPVLMEEDAVLRKAIRGQKDTIHTAVHLIAVASDSDHPQVAADFARFVTNAENQLKFCKEAIILPSNKKAAEDEIFQRDLDELDDLEEKARVIAAEQLPISALHIPQLEISDDINDVMLRAVHQAARGAMTPEEALMQAYEDWMAIYEASK